MKKATTLSESPAKLPDSPELPGGGVGGGVPRAGVRDWSKASETTPEKNSEESEKNNNKNPTQKVSDCREEFEKKVANKDSPVVIFSEEEGQDRTRSEFTFGFDVNQDEELREPGPLLPPPGPSVSQPGPQTKLRTIVIDGSNVCCLTKVRKYCTVVPFYLIIFIFRTSFSLKDWSSPTTGFTAEDIVIS